MHFQGKLLTADPSILGDPYFHRAVVLIVDQNESGYVGFILNKPLGYSLEEALESVPVQDPLYFGGPVEKDNLFFYPRPRRTGCGQCTHHRAMVLGRGF